MGIFDFLKPTASGGTLEDVRRANEEADPSRVLYETGMRGMEQLQREQTQRFEAARAPQVQAVDVLGQRAQTVGGSAAMLQSQAAREAAQARAMAAPSAVLGGALGGVAAQSMQGLEQEAAQRQAGYMRGISALGAGTMQEAEERRRVEQAMIQDLQARYAAAMQQAQAQRMREAADEERMRAAIVQGVGSGIGMLGGKR